MCLWAPLYIFNGDSAGCCGFFCWVARPPRARLCLPSPFSEMKIYQKIFLDSIPFLFALAVEGSFVQSQLRHLFRNEDNLMLSNNLSRAKAAVIWTKPWENVLPTAWKKRRSEALKVASSDVSWRFMACGVVECNKMLIREPINYPLVVRFCWKFKSLLTSLAVDSPTSTHVDALPLFHPRSVGKW